MDWLKQRISLPPGLLGSPLEESKGELITACPGPAPNAARPSPTLSEENGTPPDLSRLQKTRKKKGVPNLRLEQTKILQTQKSKSKKQNGDAKPPKGRSPATNTSPLISMMGKWWSTGEQPAAVPGDESNKPSAKEEKAAAKEAARPAAEEGEQKKPLHGQQAAEESELRKRLAEAERALQHREKEFELKATELEERKVQMDLMLQSRRLQDQKMATMQRELAEAKARLPPSSSRAASPGEGQLSAPGKRSTTRSPTPTSSAGGSRVSPTPSSSASAHSTDASASNASEASTSTTREVTDSETQTELDLNLPVVAEAVADAVSVGELTTRMQRLERELISQKVLTEQTLARLATKTWELSEAHATIQVLQRGADNSASRPSSTAAPSSTSESRAAVPTQGGAASSAATESRVAVGGGVERENRTGGRDGAP